MPRKRPADAPPPKRRSRAGCHNCKRKKIKCGEEKPTCSHCENSGEGCDYSLKLKFHEKDALHLAKAGEKFARNGVLDDDSRSPESSGSPPNKKIRRTASASRLSEFSSSTSSEDPAAPYRPLFSRRATAETAGFSDCNLDFNAHQTSASPIFSAGDSTPRSTVQHEGLESSVWSPTDSEFGDHSRRVVATPENLAADIVPLNQLQGVPTAFSMARGVNSQMHQLNQFMHFHGHTSLTSSQTVSTSGQQRPEVNEHRPQFDSTTPPGSPTVFSFMPLNTPLATFSSDGWRVPTVGRPSMREVWQGMAEPRGRRREGPIRSGLVVTRDHLSSGNVNRSVLDTGPRLSPGLKPPVFTSADLLMPPLLLGQTPQSQRTSVGLPSLNTLIGSGEDVEYYGIDKGLPDFDLGRNKDMDAISGLSPTEQGHWPTQYMTSPSLDNTRTAAQSTPSSSPLPSTTSQSQEQPRHGNNYYAKEVRVMIPRSLLPLPELLLNNKMNLLYFHHFLSHTAGMLAPHDDPLSNPFRNDLPRLALRNEALLRLLIAYSAAHRARHLNHPEPKNRIAELLRPTISAVRNLSVRALRNSNAHVDTADLATAVMLASLEIVSPASMGTIGDGVQDASSSIPWQGHLEFARAIIASCRGRGSGPNEGQSTVTATASRDGTDSDSKARAFLWSWFAYLDVLGSLSGGRGGGKIWRQWVQEFEAGDKKAFKASRSANNSAAAPAPAKDNNDQIDCIMGFTIRCLYLLVKLSELVRECRAERISWTGVNANAELRAGWIPSATLAVAARALEKQIKASLNTPAIACEHVREAAKRTGSVDVSSGDSCGGGKHEAMARRMSMSVASPSVSFHSPTMLEGSIGPNSTSSPTAAATMPTTGLNPTPTPAIASWDAEQMVHTNRAHHWAALVHLYRRVLGSGSDDGDVRLAVLSIMSCLHAVEKGSPAEACMVFPMFTAGCELTDEGDRKLLLERIQSVERTGMMQVAGARQLIQKVWETGKPWETLLTNEFIG